MLDGSLRNISQTDVLYLLMKFTKHITDYPQSSGMPARTLLEWPADVVFRPSEFVRVDPAQETANTFDAIVETIRITAFYFLNLLLYAAPLTLAGVRVREGATAPPLVAAGLEPLPVSPDTVWQLTSSMIVNGAFLLLGTVLTFVTFHIGIVLSGSSRGILRSLRAVSYSTGIYLAVIYSVLVAVSTKGFTVAENLLLWIQSAFVQSVIDFVGADLVSPVEATRPDLSAITTVEQAILTVLLLAAVYFLYVLYAGARASHDATRVEALVATGFVLVSPALYVLATIFLEVGLP